MNRAGKVFFWMGGVLLFLLCLLASAAPLLINLDAVHGAIEARFHRETGGRDAFRELDLFFLPRPHVVIRGVSVTFPGQKSLAVEAVTLYPELLPLLKGDIRPAKVLLSSPRMRLALSSHGQDGNGEISFFRMDGRSGIPREVRSWIRKAEGLVIQVENGRLDVMSTENRSFRFSGINVSVDNDNGGFSIQLSCAASLFRRMDLKGRFDPASLKSEGTLSLSGFRTDGLPDNSRFSEMVRLGNGIMDLEMDFSGTGFRDLKATVRVSAPSLGLWRGKRKIVVKGARIKGRVHLGEDALEVSLSRMTLDYPRLALSGAFKMKQDVPSVRLHLRGEGVDVAATRSCALALAGDVPAVRSIFDVVADGHVSFISVRAHGKSLKDLGRLDRYTIKGHMRRGRIFVPGLDLDLTNVQGNALISKGLLSGQRLCANLGNIKGREGLLVLGLAKDAAPFHLDIQVDADLTEVHSVLKRLVTKGAFAEDLRHIRSMEGQASARLCLDEKEGGLLVDVACSSCRMKALYRLLPFPVTIERGAIHYRGKQAVLRNVAGTFGRSKLSLASGLLDWRNKPWMEIGSLKATVFPEQIHQLLTVMEPPGKWLKTSNGIKGRVSVHSLDMKGPLMKPAAWRYQADLEVLDLSLNPVFLPFPVNVSKARVKADAGSVRFSNAKIDFLDTGLIMAGRLKGPLAGLKGFETTLSGKLGAKAVQYLYETLELPVDFLVRTPLTVSSGSTRWDKGAGMSFEGELLFPHGPHVSLDGFLGPEKLNIRKLIVADEASNASLGLRVCEDLIEVDFSGKLQKSALDGMFVKNQFLDGWIQGEITARVRPSRSFSVSAEGVLTGTALPVYGVDPPVRIEDFSLHAEGQLLRVAPTRVALGENELVISGSANLSREDPRFDVDISTESVDLNKVLKTLEGYGNFEEPEAGKDDPWVFPVRGTAHLMWDSMELGPYTWRPFKSEVTVGPEGVRVDVANGIVCGVSTPGMLRFTPGGIQFDFRLEAEKRDLNQCMACLTREKVIVEGIFDLEGSVKGEGHWENLFERLEGPLVFSSTDGRVKQDPTLGRVLSVLNITNIFKGKLPTLERDGLPYDLITIKANLKNGKIKIHEGIMNSTSVNLIYQGDVDMLNDQLDITMVASPFTLTDRLIKLIPVAGYILGGALLSVPIKVDGSMEDPKVRILPLSEIGSSMWGIMKRTFEMPARIMEPLMGAEGTENKGDAF